MNLSPLPLQKFFDNNGRPLSGGLLFTYVAGTSTKLATYSDESGTLNTNPVVLNFRGEANVWLDQTLAYKFVLAPEGDTDPPTKPIWSVDNISAGITFTSLTQQLIGQILYPRSADEIAASITPVNYWYPYGYVDRYGTNTTPGTTDMSSAFNAAVQVAARVGCTVRWGATAPYRLNSPINVTQIYGVVFSDESSSYISAGSPSLIVAHTGHGFDLSASSECVFYNVSITNLAGTVPKTAFFMARNAAGSGAGAHRIYNLRTPSNCTFSHVIYAYASEENTYSDCLLYNSQAGSTILYINGTNPAGYTSSFVTIATGAQSNVTHFVSRTDLFNSGNSGSGNEVCIMLERAGNFSWIQGSAYCPHGLAYIGINGTLGINFFTVDSIRAETDGTGTPFAGIAVRTTAATGANSHAHWKLQQFAFDTAGTGYLLDCNSTSDILDLSTRNCFSSSGNLLNVHSLSYSIIEHSSQVVVAQAGGTVANTHFIGLRANVTLSGTVTAVSYVDQQLAVGGFNGVRFPATQVSSADVNTLDDYEEGTWTPTLTFGSGSVTYTTQTGTYTKVGRLVTIQCFIQVNTPSAPSGSLKLSGLPFTSTSGLKGAASVYANTIGALSIPIMGIVDSAATTLSLFKLSGGTLANLGGDVGAGTNFSITASYETAT